MPDNPEEDRIEASSVLCFIATALGDLRHRVEHVEAHAADLVAASPRDAGSLIVLQDLDLLRQTIEDLARLAAVAGENPRSGRKALASALRLAALRDRLTGGQAHRDAAGVVTDEALSGRIEFFTVERRPGG